MKPDDVTDDMVWQMGARSFAFVARAYNTPYQPLFKVLARRGWKKHRPSGFTYQAPCAGCGTPTPCGPDSPPPAGLDANRHCRECRAAPAEDPRVSLYRRELAKRRDRMDTEDWQNKYRRTYTDIGGTRAA